MKRPVSIGSHIIIFVLTDGRTNTEGHAEVNGQWAHSCQILIYYIYISNI
jgi:hypothetical protein